MRTLTVSLTPDWRTSLRAAGGRLGPDSFNSWSPTPSCTGPTRARTRRFASPGSTTALRSSAPGGPFGVVNQENFGQPNFADYRNLELAKSMRVLGIVQRFGVGIRMAQTAVRDAGLVPIAWEVSAAHVRATIHLGRK